MPSLVTKGDAEAVFNTSLGAGRIIRRQAVVSPPADPERKVAIRPFAQGFNGRHYCAKDWHAILVSQFDGGDSPGYSQQDAKNFLSQITTTFTLDGAELHTAPTAIKRLLDPKSLPFPVEWEVAYFQNVGQLMPPDALSVGSHSLSYIEDSPEGHYEDGITFFIDPAGQGACL